MSGWALWPVFWICKKLHIATTRTLVFVEFSLSVHAQQVLLGHVALTSLTLHFLGPCMIAYLCFQTSWQKAGTCKAINAVNLGLYPLTCYFLWKYVRGVFVPSRLLLAVVFLEAPFMGDYWGDSLEKM